MKKELNKALDNFQIAEKKLKKALSKLENYGNECHCEDVYEIKLLHYGEWTEIQTFCLDCGGSISENGRL